MNINESYYMGTKMSARKRFTIQSGLLATIAAFMRNIRSRVITNSYLHFIHKINSNVKWRQWLTLLLHGQHKIHILC